MDPTRVNRRVLLRSVAMALATGGASSLAGCGDPGDGDGEDEDADDDGGWGYREDEFDPVDQAAGTSAGGSSPG